jgi:hypothetical protein
MQLGKTLVGAIIGAALGIGLLVLVYLLFNLEQVWLAIPVGILTGLGVRTLVSTSGHASYLRGAITGVLALAAYLGGWYVVKEVAVRRAGAPAQRPANVVTAQAEEDTDEPSGDADAQPVPVPQRPVPRPGVAGEGIRKAPGPSQFSTFDFIYLCVAALIAYELGRGTGAKPVATTEPAPEDVPQGTHPDA